MSHGSHSYVFDKGYESAISGETKFNPYRYFSEMWKRYEQGYEKGLKDRNDKAPRLPE